MKEQKELTGQRTHINIQVWSVRPIKHWINMPGYWRRRCDGLAKCPKHTQVFKVEDLDTIEKMAFCVRRHWGHSDSKGFFFIYVWGYQKNKRYNPEFTCTLKRCPLYKSNECRVWSRHQKGWHCKRNKKGFFNWCLRAAIKILPFESEDPEKDYRYIFLKKYDKMYYFKRWFWKGNPKEKREEIT